MTLLSLAAKQIWPHVLTVARLKPVRVFLLHSQDAAESKGPAQRLKRFFDESGLVPRGGTRLELNPIAEELLSRIQEELSIGQTKVMKEDLLAVREAGGLLGNVVCVRKAELPEEVIQYAPHNNIAVVRKSELVPGFRNLLNPHRPPDSADIAALAAHFRQ